MKVISLLIYKIASKLNNLTAKLKTKFRPPFDGDARRHGRFEMSEDGFYCFNLLGRQIVAPMPECYTGLYKPIFNREIYAFNSSSDRPLIIDCGSNIGLGIIFWKMKYPNARIIAFEPSTKVFEALQRNIQEFNLEDVEIINAALSDSDGEKEFTVNEGVSGSLVLEKNLGKAYLVKTVRLDNYLSEKIDFLKVDIEGEEIKIFPQIAKNLNNIENLFIEYHSFVNHPQRLSLFLEELEKSGFRYYIEGEYRHNSPLHNDHVKLNQDLQVSIWAKRTMTR